MLQHLKALWRWLVTDRFYAFKDRHNPAKSENGFLMIDKDGVARVDYSNPHARQKLADQINFFATIKVNQKS